MMCVVDPHAMYIKDEGSTSYYVVDNDWSTPFMGLWINMFGQLGFYI